MSRRRSRAASPPLLRRSRRANFDIGPGKKSVQANVLLYEPELVASSSFNRAHMPGEAALAVLRDSAQSPDPHVRRIAVEAIGIPSGRKSFGRRGVPLLSDAHGAVVRSACEAAAARRVMAARSQPAVRHWIRHRANVSTSTSPRSIIAPCEEPHRVVRSSRRSSRRPRQPADPSHGRSSQETSAGSIMLHCRCRTPKRC